MVEEQKKATKREENKKKKKEEILKFLENYGRSASSKISIFIGLPSNYSSTLFEELEAEGKIIKEAETNSTYWKLK